MLGVTLPPAVARLGRMAATVARLLGCCRCKKAFRRSLIRTWACYVGTKNILEVAAQERRRCDLRCRCHFAAKGSMRPTSSTLEARNRHAGATCAHEKYQSWDAGSRCLHYDTHTLPYVTNTHQHARDIKMSPCTPRLLLCPRGRCNESDAEMPTMWQSLAAATATTRQQLAKVGSPFDT